MRFGQSDSSRALINGQLELRSTKRSRNPEGISSLGLGVMLARVKLPRPAGLDGMAGSSDLALHWMSLSKTP